MEILLIDEYFKATFSLPGAPESVVILLHFSHLRDLYPLPHVDVTVSFSPQNYTVPEGTPAELMVVLDKPSVKNITITVTTMDITAEGEYMFVHERVSCMQQLCISYVNNGKALPSCVFCLSPQMVLTILVDHLMW